MEPDQTSTTTTKHEHATTMFLDRPGGRIAYDVSGQGPLVIATPGMGDLRSVYRFLAPALVEAGYRVATVDLRGHGDSDASFDEYGSVPTAKDTLALVEELGGGPATLIGNSMSAGSAVWVAAESPGLVEGLVLIGAFVRDPEASRVAELVMRLALIRPWGPRAWGSQYARLYPGRRPDDFDAHRDEIGKRLADPNHWSAFVQTTRTSHAAAEARLDKVDSATLVIMGEHDPDWKDPKAEADFIAGRLDGTVVVVPKAGHYPQAEYPEITTPAILDFLAARKGAATAEPSSGGSRRA